jgi:hypothetical protein
MNFVASLTAITLLIDFLVGAVYGVVGGASLAFFVEGRRRDSLRRKAPSLLCEGARVLQAAVALPGRRDSFDGRDGGDAYARRKEARS